MVDTEFYWGKIENPMHLIAVMGFVVHHIEEYVSLLTVFENLEALYICRNVITVYPNCKSMIDVAKQKLMNDPTFKHLSEDCQAYYFDFEAYASHLQEHGKFLVTEHGIFELPE